MDKETLKQKYFTPLLENGERILWCDSFSPAFRQRLFSLFSSSVKSKELYCVTDRRIFVFRKGRKLYRPIEETGAMTLVKINDNKGNLMFGDENSDFGFCCIDDYVAVYKLISDQIRIIRQNKCGG